VEGRRSLRCLIAAGGTAGHVLPALAVAEELVARGVEVTFAGSPERVEARLVPEAGYAFDAFRVSGLPRRPGLALARAGWLAGRAPLAARAILRRRRPDVVLGAGGFVAGPVVFAAWTLRIPAAVTEADAHLGLANRLAAPYARRIFTAYPLGAGSKERVVGRPIPTRSRAVPRDAARRELGLPADGRVLLVAGALAGARSLNEAVVEAFGERGPVVLHLTGDRDLELVRARVRRDDYVARAAADPFGAALGAADLALARAGGSVWELAAAGLPAVLVPYPHATGDHQAKNAAHFERLGGAVVVPDAELGRATRVAAELLEDDSRLASMREAMLRAARPDAAARIAEELIELARAARR
jgi:UDP-N-acetylglucosamine--N-acetylmuramyl-(pentapeptide) pyrophosphoryl-undecaprenol N-acetylglucosamine transferase